MASEFRRKLRNEAIGPHLADLRRWLFRRCMALGKDGIGAITDLLCSWDKACIILLEYPVSQSPFLVFIEGIIDRLNAGLG